MQKTPYGAWDSNDPVCKTRARSRVPAHAPAHPVLYKHTFTDMHRCHRRAHVLRSCAHALARAHAQDSKQRRGGRQILLVLLKVAAGAAALAGAWWIALTLYHQAQFLNSTPVL